MINLLERHNDASRMPIVARNTCMPPAFYDLCASETLLEAQTRRERVATALKLGFGCAALVHQAGYSLTDHDRCDMIPIEPESLQTATNDLKQALKAFHTEAGRHATPEQFKQLTRINIPASDPGAVQTACSNYKVLSTYDLVAVQPQSESAFACACTSLDIDIICIDVASRPSYKFKSALINSAVEKGIHFELCYAPALREAGAKRQLIATAQALSWETKGKNIVLSSGARTSSEIRGPQDIINLGTFLGMSEHQARCAISANSAAVLDRASSRKSVKGIVTVHANNKHLSKKKVEQPVSSGRVYTALPSFAKLVSDETAAAGNNNKRPRTQQTSSND